MGAVSILQMPRLTARLLVLMLLGCAAFCLFVAVALADEGLPGKDEGSQPESVSGLATDRKTTVALEEFRRHVEQSAMIDALEDFQRLQTSDASVMVPARDDSETVFPLYRSLFNEFYTLPVHVRRLIKESSQFAADRRFRQITADGDFEFIPQFILRHTGTEASLQAHLLLARLHLDRGNTLGAMAWLKPLSFPAVDDTYRLIAVEMLDRLNADSGEFVKTRHDAEAESGPAPIPTSIRWQFRSQVSPKIRKQLSTFLDVALESGTTPQATWSDFQDGSTVYRRTLRGLLALNLETGKPRWQYPIDPQLDASLANARSNTSAFAREATNLTASNRFATLERTALANAFCRDNITGQMTGDSERLYLVANNSNPAISANAATIGFMRSNTVSTFRGSRLLALEKKTGRRVWSASAATFGDLAPSSQGVWFAGVPTVRGDRLYSVVERNGEIQLACLAARTGELHWTASLSWPDQSIDKDPIRQLWSATPVVQEGLVWCPTTTGWMTCVDQVTRSVVWASRLHANQPEELAPTRRGRPVVMTPASSLRERWALSKVVRAENSLVVLPHEAHEIVILDPLSGRKKKRIPIDASSVLLHLDDTVIVVSEEHQIVCRNIQTGDERWSRDLSALDEHSGQLTGQAVLQGDNLLVHTSSGSVIRIALASGEVLESTPDVLPKLAWGQLMEFGNAKSGDLLYSTPDRLIRLSAEASNGPAGSPVELAAELMNAQKWREALEIAETVSADDRDRRRAEEIRFECRLRLAATDSQTQIPMLHALARSPEQQIQVHMLEVDVLLKGDQIQKAAEELTEILKRAPNWLQLPISKTTPDEPSLVSLSLRTWAATALVTLLDRIPHPDAVVERLDETSLTVLLSIQHPAMLPLLYGRLEETSSREMKVQLLRHAVAVKSRAAAGGQVEFSREIEFLSQLVADIQAGSDATERHVATRLLNVTVLEMTPRFADAVAASPLFQGGGFYSLETQQQMSRNRLQQRSSDWSADTYRAIPVARLRSMGRYRKSLTFANPEDAFLSGFAWSATSGQHGRLQARSVLDDDDQSWSIPGNFHLHGNYSYQQDILRRVGSVLLLKSWTTLSAVSVLDQKVIWSKSFKYAPVSGSSGAAENFDRFVPQTTRFPSQRMPSSFHVVGTGHGWVALANDSEFSMIEIASGNTIWSRKIAPRITRSVASSTAVLEFSEEGLVAMFDAANGERLSVEKSWASIPSPIRNAEQLLVCWKHSPEKHDPRLQWIDPLTMAVVNEIDLSQMKCFQFVDDDTLAAFDDQQKMTLVSLTSGESQSLSFSAGVPPSDAANESDDLPLWGAQRVQVSADALNYYVSNRKGSGSPSSVRAPANRNLTTLRGGLRAINRESGELRWEFQNTKQLMCTTDESSLPILLLIDAPTQNADGTAAQQATFSGIDKLTGKELFQQRIPTQSGLRTLFLNSPAPRVLDIGVQGLRVRVEGERSALAP